MRINIMISQLLEIITKFTLSAIQQAGYTGVFLLMALESANIPIPSEVIMPFSGFLVASGVFNFWLVSVVGAFGNLVGSLFSYWLGSLIRRDVLHWDNHKVSKEVKKAEDWLHRFGNSAVFVSRLLPVARTFISFPIGVLDSVPVWRFSILTFVGALLWSILLTWMGIALNENWHSLEGYFRKFDYLILGSILLAGAWFIWRHYLKKDVEAEKIP